MVACVGAILLSDWVRGERTREEEEERVRVLGRGGTAGLRNVRQVLSGAEPRCTCRARERYLFCKSEPSPLSEPDKDLFNLSVSTGRLMTFMLGVDLDRQSVEDPLDRFRRAQLPSGTTSRSLGVSGIERRSIAVRQVVVVVGLRRARYRSEEEVKRVDLRREAMGNTGG